MGRFVLLVDMATTRQIVSIKEEVHVQDIFIQEFPVEGGNKFKRR